MIILDTNVVSELMRATPDPAVAAWAVKADSESLVTTLTVAEIRYGIARLPEGRRRQEISAAAHKVLTAFARRIVPFDLAAAECYGDLVAGCEAKGRAVSVVDAQIAAVCHARSAALATRNVKDFEGAGLVVINPWDA